MVLSFLAALGISALAFEHLFGFAGADSSLPLFVFVFLVALGIDYNIFLMTRVHEEARQHGTRRGALVGLAATGGVITSAGLVLAGTFSVLATLPVVAFAEIGFAVAIGILLDTIVVRLRPRDGTQPRHRPLDVVAEPPGREARRRGRGARSRGARAGRLTLRRPPHRSAESPRNAPRIHWAS